MTLVCQTCVVPSSTQTVAISTASVTHSSFLRPLERANPGGRLEVPWKLNRQHRFVASFGCPFGTLRTYPTGRDKSKFTLKKHPFIKDGFYFKLIYTL